MSESCSWKKHFEADGRLFLRQNWSCCKPVNSEWYTTICLPKVVDEIRKTNKIRRIIVHHDSSYCHRLKPAPFWPANTWNWWVVRRTVLNWLFLFQHVKKQNALSTIFAIRSSCWSVQKPCFGGKDRSETTTLKPNIHGMNIMLCMSCTIRQ